MIHPGETFPAITLNNVDGGHWDLPANCSKPFTLLLVYRGLHCGVCAAYLREFANHLDKLEALGVEVFATSADAREKALQARLEWTGDRMQIAYGLDADAGRKLGLFRSSARKPVEPDQFFEPGLYIILASGELLFVSLQNMPFGRTPVQDVLDWLPRVVANQIPPRGTLRY